MGEDQSAWYSRLYSFGKNAVVRLIRGVQRAFALIWLTSWHLGKACMLTIWPARTSLSGRVVLVTGGAGGVGKHLAERLVKRGAKVVLWDVDEAALQKVENELGKEGHSIHTYTVDVSDKQSVYKNAQLVKEEIGPVDVLINNAGIVCGKPLLELPDEDIERTYNVNILSHYWVSFKNILLLHGYHKTPH